MIALISVLSTLLMRHSADAMTEQIRHRMLDITNTAASMLDGDALEKLTAQDVDTPEYQAALDTLRHFQDNIDLEYIYCIQDLGDKKFAFTVDPAVDDPGTFGESIAYTDALYAASLGTPSVDDKPYEDKWGRFYSAYTPVFNSQGGVAGIVAVDFKADWFEKQLATLTRTFIIIVALVCLLGGVFAYAVIKSLRGRVRSMYQQVNGLADHVEELLVEIEGPASKSARQKRRVDDIANFKGDEVKMLGDRILGMEDELLRHIEQIRSQAFVDGLTSVRNKAAYLDMENQINALIEKNTAEFTVCVFDLNGLKTINDNFGHMYGDQALIDLANILMRVYRSDDLYRVGGDEFIAIIKEHSMKAVENLFNQLDLELIEFNKNEHPYVVPLAVSKGYAIYCAGYDTKFREVCKRADEMMYADKAAYYARVGDRRRRRTLEVEDVIPPKPGDE